jgi:hypothetical protein
VQAPHLERPNPYRHPLPRRREGLRFDGTSVLLAALGLTLAALPFVQLALTGAASQTDLGVSVILLFLLAGMIR